MPAPRPYNLVAELTYRCPLRCVYCSNPLGFRAVREALDGTAWSGVFREAAALGVVHVGLTGGEPTVHPDIEEIVAGAAAASLYPHLVTAGTALDSDRLGALVRAGLRSVQLSIQDADAAASDAIAGAECFDAKLAFAAAVRAHDLPLTLNVVLHRKNLGRVAEIVALARRIGAARLELANAQYHGFALKNRAALLPAREALDAAAAEVAALRAASCDLEILFVLPDYYRGRPKPCMGGWGRSQIVVAPDGRVLPCHGAAELPGLEFWRPSPSASLADMLGRRARLERFRGEAWMPGAVPDCTGAHRDFGGCRCQAFQLVGDAAATDPACELSPHHDVVLRAREAAEQAAAKHAELVYRG